MAAKDISELITPRLLQDCLSTGQMDVESLKNYLNKLNDILDEAFEQGIRIEHLVTARARGIDYLLQNLWEETPLARSDAASLIAVGGYGRGELHPYSDIDILILHTELDQTSQGSLESFITLLWDIGLKPGHAVRSLSECETLARNDITVITNLIESRAIAGPHHLLDELRYLINEHNMWDSKDFFQSKKQEQTLRHQKYHSTSFAIEPNLKESPGGLRDVQTVTWIAKRHFKASGLYELAHLGVFTLTEYRTLSNCLSFLWKVRYALHRVAGRAEERLLFDFQKRVAELLGYRGATENAAVEQFMKKYFRTVMKVRDFNDLLLQVFELEILKHGAKLPVHNIDKQFQLRGENIEAISSHVFRDDPSALLRIFKIFVEFPQALRMSATTLRLVTSHKNLIDDKFRDDKKNQSNFIEFFRAKGNLARALTLFKRSGILGAYLPAFAKIAGQMQFDMFHIYTVDEHTLFLMRNIAHFSEEDNNQFSICRQIMTSTPNPEIAFLAGLFHDIAKGRGGDHSTLGAEDAALFCHQHNLPIAHAQIIVWLVENHLLMSTTAQKKDISDPNIINEFAQQVRSVERLEFLYVLTVADIRATNPSLWNGWKDALLRELFISAKLALEHGIAQALNREQHIEEIKQDALLLLASSKLKKDDIKNHWQRFNDDYFQAHKAEQIAWHSRSILGYIDPNGDINQHQAIAKFRPHPDAEATELFVFVVDKHNVFAAITSFLAEHHLDIQAASIHTGNDEYCLDSFVVLQERAVSTKEMQGIAQALQERLDNLGSSLPAFQKRTSRKLKNFNIKTEVKFSNQRENNFTIMELSALEQSGLLSLVSQAFIECKVRLLSAKIVTLGERIEDVFTICDIHNKPIKDPIWQDKIRQNIIKLLDS